MTETTKKMKIKALRTVMACSNCGHLKKKMTFIKLIDHVQDFCRECNSMTDWVSKFHVIVYEEVSEDENQDY